MIKMEELKTKCKNEIRSFFGLTVVNLVIAALIMALGIGLGVTQLLALVELGTIQLIPLLLVSAGFIAAVAGVYWLIKTAEILDGVDDITSAYEEIPQHDNQEQITGVLVQMIAHYRKNKPIIDTMTILGRIGGILFLVAGSLSLVYAVNTLLTSGIVLEGISQLAGGIMAFAFLFVLAGAEAVQANRDEKPGIEPRERYLLLDERLISSVDNAELKLGIVKKHPANPLFKDELPWEVDGSHMYLNVLFDPDDKLYKCWYYSHLTGWQKDVEPGPLAAEERNGRGNCATLYATSKDGVISCKLLNRQRGI